MSDWISRAELMSEDELAIWEQLREDCEGGRCGIFRRLHVAPEVGSTQDLARTFAAGSEGLIVAALRQTAGRGRLGRVWADTSHLGLAMTFVISAARQPAGVLALAAGLAALRASQAHLPPECKQLGLRWPNDVVLPREGTKLAGVLIEQFDGMALVGIGINVRQSGTDFSPPLRDRVTSLRMLGSEADRPSVASTLSHELAAVIQLPPASIAAEWSRRDVLAGTYRTFEWNNARYSGLVRAIDPLGEIVLRLDSGDTRTLPALTTSLVKEE